MNALKTTLLVQAAVLAIAAGAHASSYAHNVDNVGMPGHPKHNVKPQMHPDNAMYHAGWNNGMKYQQELDQRLNGRQDTNVQTQQDQHQNQRSYSGAGAAGYSLNAIEGNRSNVTVNEGSDAHHYNQNHNYTDQSRELTIIPVNVQAPASINPTANVSRMVGGECGPRMKIMQRTVHGVNNRFFGAHKVELGSDDTLISANEPYRYVTLPNGDMQALGHRVIETTAAINTSSAYGFGAGGNSSSGSAGSLGVSSSGAMQRLVTSIRLQDCVAFIAKKAPVKPVVASQPVRKAVTPTRAVRRPVRPVQAPVRRVDPNCGCVVTVRPAGTLN